jgi:methylmalonyl-CoA/ethylmalonyl-CoA epimerase
MTAAAGSWLGLGPVFQFGVVTDDIEQAVARTRATAPDSVWSSWTYGPDLLKWQRIGPDQAAFSLRLAITGTNPQMEFLQPLDDHTSFARKLAADGQSLHHVGILVSDFAAESARLIDLGIEALESAGGHGVDGDGAFGYFDTVALCGVLIELIERPAQRREPHRLFAPVGS